MVSDRLAIPRTVADELLSHARAEVPNEACGLVSGSLADGTAGVWVWEWKMATRSSPASSMPNTMRTRSSASTVYTYGLASALRAGW